MSKDTTNEVLSCSAVAVFCWTTAGVHRNDQIGTVKLATHTHEGNTYRHMTFD